MIYEFFEILFSLTTPKQKLAMWKVENRYRYEMSKLARRMHSDEFFGSLGEGKKLKYAREAQELLDIRNKLMESIKEHPEKIKRNGDFR